MASRTTTSQPPPTIVWFRSDLRLADHRALAAAIDRGGAVVPVFVLDDAAAGRWVPGGASRWWLHHSLAALAADLARRGSRLLLRRGPAADVLADLARETGATAVHCSRRYEPWAAAQESAVRDGLAARDVALKRFAGRLLIEPEQIATAAGEPFKVYTPFWRALSQRLDVQPPLPAPERIVAPAAWPRSDRLADWKLLPLRPNWASGFEPVWQPGESGASARLAAFLARAASYADDRNRPDIDATSRLSPHLAHGELSPRQIWWRVASLRATGAAEKGLETFLRELVWREFSAHLLFHYPHLPDTPLRPEFAAFPWRRDQAALDAWQRGRTGYPIVDAGMRQLWATGWMHNRVRMIVASFLVKDLLVPWQDGEAWFWDTLVDADLASNAASWQWVAGSGADAAPFFRVFNPVTQGVKFDPDGDYVRAFVPELADRRGAAAHEPLPSDRDLGLSAAENGYPPAIVDHRLARQCALEAFQSLKSASRR